uniref:Rab3 GTPase-activating protein catalytic subunit n=1 Tax=Kalanchoe fedtschenkoi TaxID=63787 RepID=A0A7N0RFL3_KALFE
MASSSNVNSGFEDDLEDDLGQFDDFTLASSWERFISDIEAVCRQWLIDGPEKLLEKGAVRWHPSHDLYQQKVDLKYAAKNYCMEYYFGSSLSGKSTDWECTLHDLQLSFGVNEFLAIAPQSAHGVVLDAPEASKLLSAVAIALTNCNSLWPAFVPVHDPSRRAYIGIQNMGTVFTKRFEADRIGSQVPLKLMHLEGLHEMFVSKFAYSTVDFSLHAFQVRFSMRLRYRTVPCDDDDDVLEGNRSVTVQHEEVQRKTLWDDDCPWSEWYSAEDPVKGFELISIWAVKIVETSLEMAELENSSPHDAEKWILIPDILPDLGENAIGFASQLRLLADALNMSDGAQFMEDFVSVESVGSDNAKSSGVIPPPTVLDRVLKDLFHEEGKFHELKELKNLRSIKGAPSQSLFAHFSLHCLWFGNCNIRAVALLWIEFVREVRWCWEELQPLPKMPVSGSIDLSTCLIYQKLQMRLHVDPSGGKRRGSVGLFGSMMLLNSQQNMHAPFTQDPPLMTEDMHEERLQAVEALGDSLNFAAQLEREVLSSDMSAFKAANPDSIFEDFIRWHSPGDWESDDNDNPGVPKSRLMEGLQTSWPPKGRLSQRMSDRGNSWRKIWDETPALSVAEQKPLFDPNREGEKIVHYLETVPPHQLLEQMICTAFRAAADTLYQTDFGDLKLMRTKIEQLVVTIASAMQPLQANRWSDKSEILQDLQQLCTTFGHVEKLVTLAASLHRKLSQAPRLSEAIFNEYFNAYLPRMGTPSVNSQKEPVEMKHQKVSYHERQAVSNLFPPPSANQSWRKVLSMGNLLNGHEPITREIIFSTQDGASSSHYSAGTHSNHQIETFRMYICGTSNDLRVALSVTSCD